MCDTSLAPFLLRASVLSAVPGSMLYEYPEWGYNVYAEPEMTMEIAEPSTSPWVHANADPGTSPATARCLAGAAYYVVNVFTVKCWHVQVMATWTRGSRPHKAQMRLLT